MAVYRHGYQPYYGPSTPAWSRFLILPRYAYRMVFQFRLVTAFLVACLVVPVGAAVFIYLHFNVSALRVLQVGVDELLPIDRDFFLFLLSTQGFMAFLLTVLVGPGLVSPDLTNNALPLYLSRPFRRMDYVIGKMSVLLILQSGITWIPLLLLFWLQLSLSGSAWARVHWRILPAVFFGSWIWILLLAILALAISAWVRWKPIAAAMLFSIFFVAEAFGEIMNQVFLTSWGDLLKMHRLIHSIWVWLFFGDQPRTRLGWFQNAVELPLWCSWIGLAGIVALSLFLLRRLLRAYEVIR